MLQEQQKNQLLKELNAKCAECSSTQLNTSGSVDYGKCHKCMTGSVIHMLDNPEWDKIDWNSFVYNSYYGQ